MPVFAEYERRFGAIDRKDRPPPGVAVPSRRSPMPMASRRPLPANHPTNVVSLTERRHPGLSIGRFSIPMVPTLRTAPTRVTRRAVKLRAVLNWCGEGISNMLPLTWTTPRCRIGGPPEISPLPCGSSICGHGPDRDVDRPVLRVVVRRMWNGRDRDYEGLGACGSNVDGSVKASIPFHLPSEPIASTVGL